MVQNVMTNTLTSYDKKKYIDDDGSGIFSRQNIRQVYTANYLNKYYNRRNVLEID